MRHGMKAPQGRNRRLRVRFHDSPARGATPEAILLSCIIVLIFQCFLLKYVRFLHIVGVRFLQGAVMRKIKPKTLRARIEARVARKARDSVFLTREFRDLSGEGQVQRALREIVRDGRLVRLGYGVYARAVISRLSGEPLLANPTGLRGAAREALTKLGVKWEPTESERAYNEGRSTQIPVNPVLRVKSRFSRRLKDGNTVLVLER